MPRAVLQDPRRSCARCRLKHVSGVRNDHLCHPLRGVQHQIPASLVADAFPWQKIGSSIHCQSPDVRPRNRLAGLITHDTLQHLSGRQHQQPQIDIVSAGYDVCGAQGHASGR